MMQQEKEVPSPKEMKKTAFTLNLFMANFSSHVLVVALIILTPMMKSSLQLSYWSISCIFFSIVLGDQLGRSICARIQHKLSIHRMLFWGSILATIGALFISFSTPWFLIAFSAALIMVARVFTTAATEYLTPFSPMLTVRFGGIFSMFMSAVLISFLIDYQVYWQMTFFLLMPLSLIVLILNRPYYTGKHGCLVPLRSWNQLSIYLKNKSVIGVLFLFAALRALSNVSMLWLPLFITDGMGQSVFRTSLVIIFWFGLFGCARAILPLLLKFMRPTVIFISAIVLSVVSILAAFFITPAFVYFLSVNGLAIGLLLPIFYQLLQAQFSDETAYISQLIFALAALLDILLHLLIGQVAYLHGIGAAFLFIPIFGALALGVGLFLSEKDSKQQLQPLSPS